MARRAIPVLTALAVSTLAACDDGAKTATPTQPAAFEMTVLAEVPCPEGVTATACVRVRVTNRGDIQGDGYCRLRGHITIESGEEQQIFGPRIDLSGIPGHSSIERILRWVKDVPGEGFSGFCEPGLKL